MISNAGRATTCKVNFNVPSLKNKCTKSEELFEIMSFSKIPFEIFNEKKIKQSFTLDQTTPCNTEPRESVTEYGPCKQ